MMLEGRVWRYGDHVDTDAIISARYLNSFDPEKLKMHCMEDIDRYFVENVRCGDIMVAGENFGCGSSREHAPVAIRFSGISIVIAASFSRLFFRNAVNIGLPVLEIANGVEKIADGDRLRVDLCSGIVENISTGDTLKAASLPTFARDIIEAGGLINYKKHQNK